MSDAPAAAKQKKWYDPTYCGGMSPEEIDVFLGSPDSALALPARRAQGGRLALRDAHVVPVARRLVLRGRAQALGVGAGPDPRSALLRLHRRGGDAARGRPAEGARPLHGRRSSRVLSSPRARSGSPVADEMAGRYAGEAGREGLKLSYGWERYLVRLDPVEGGMTTWQGVGWAKRYLDPQQRAELEALMADMASASS